jgi:hypothetical protein
MKPKPNEVRRLADTLRHVRYAAMPCSSRQGWDAVARHVLENYEPNPADIGVKPGDERDWQGCIRCMFVLSGWIVARRISRLLPAYRQEPFVVSAREWLKFGTWPPGETPKRKARR